MKGTNINTALLWQKCVSRNAKIRHCNTVTRTEIHYGAETLSLKNKGLVEELERKQRAILRESLGVIKKYGEKWVKINNETIYPHIQSITTHK